MICLNSASHTKNVSITAGCLHLAEMLKQFLKQNMEGQAKRIGSHLIGSKS